ncbi:collagen-like protein [Muriicola sp.]|uniref:collagen-like protein n=1 Tax=Muriicola sp. TaxID=2020856 RepID=UPI003C70AFE8
MKYFGNILFAFSILFISCTGDPGPPGRDGLNGLDGLDGDALLGTVFETPPIDFNVGNEFWYVYAFPNNFEVYDTDAILVYLLEGVTDDGIGGVADIWTPLPQTYFLDEGTLLYSFNHTYFDVAVFLDGNYDLSLTPDVFTQDQIFRIVVVPADPFTSANLDTSNFQGLLNALGKTESDIIKVPAQ